jgi:hypothetical protein
VHNLPISWQLKKVNLLLASYLFYAAWNPPFVLLLWLSTAVDWVVARRIYESEDIVRRRMWLVASLCVNLGVLGFFKYGDFMLQNWQMLMASFGVDYVPPAWSIVLPVGIVRHLLSAAGGGPHCSSDAVDSPVCPTARCDGVAVQMGAGSDYDRHVQQGGYRGQSARANCRCGFWV